MVRAGNNFLVEFANLRLNASQLCISLNGSETVYSFAIESYWGDITEGTISTHNDEWCFGVDEINQRLIVYETQANSSVFSWDLKVPPPDACPLSLLSPYDSPSGIYTFHGTDVPIYIGSLSPTGLPCRAADATALNVTINDGNTKEVLSLLNVVNSSTTLLEYRVPAGLCRLVSSRTLILVVKAPSIVGENITKPLVLPTCVLFGRTRVERTSVHFNSTYVLQAGEPITMKLTLQSDNGDAFGLLEDYYGSEKAPVLGALCPSGDGTRFVAASTMPVRPEGYFSIFNCPWAGEGRITFGFQLFDESFESFAAINASVRSSYATSLFSSSFPSVSKIWRKWFHALSVVSLSDTYDNTVIPEQQIAWSEMAMSSDIYCSQGHQPQLYWSEAPGGIRRLTVVPPSCIPQLPVSSDEVNILTCHSEVYRSAWSYKINHDEVEVSMSAVNLLGWCLADDGTYGPSSSLDSYTSVSCFEGGTGINCSADLLMEELDNGWNDIDEIPLPIAPFLIVANSNLSVEVLCHLNQTLSGLPTLCSAQIVDDDHMVLPRLLRSRDTITLLESKGVGTLAVAVLGSTEPILEGVKVLYQGQQQVYMPWSLPSDVTAVVGEEVVVEFLPPPGVRSIACMVTTGVHVQSVARATGRTDGWHSCTLDVVRASYYSNDTLLAFATQGQLAAVSAIAVLPSDTTAIVVSPGPDPSLIPELLHIWSFDFYGNAITSNCGDFSSNGSVAFHQSSEGCELRIHSLLGHPSVHSLNLINSIANLSATVHIRVVPAQIQFLNASVVKLGRMTATHQGVISGTINLAGLSTTVFFLQGFDGGGASVSPHHLLLEANIKVNGIAMTEGFLFLEDQLGIVLQAENPESNSTISAQVNNDTFEWFVRWQTGEVDMELTAITVVEEGHGTIELDMSFHDGVGSSVGSPSQLLLLCKEFSGPWYALPRIYQTLETSSWKRQRRYASCSVCSNSLECTPSFALQPWNTQALGPMCLSGLPCLVSQEATSFLPPTQSACTVDGGVYCTINSTSWTSLRLLHTHGSEEVTVFVQSSQSLYRTESLKVTRDSERLFSSRSFLHWDSGFPLPHNAFALMKVSTAIAEIKEISAPRPAAFEVALKDLPSLHAWRSATGIQFYLPSPNESSVVGIQGEQFGLPEEGVVRVVRGNGELLLLGNNFTERGSVQCGTVYVGDAGYPLVLCSSEPSTAGDPLFNFSLVCPEPLIPDTVEQVCLTMIASALQNSNFTLFERLHPRSCPFYRPYICWDGSCASSASACPLHFPCPSFAPYRCSTGACVAWPEHCPDQEMLPKTISSLQVELVPMQPFSFCGSGATAAPEWCQGKTLDVSNSCGAAFPGLRLCEDGGCVEPGRVCQFRPDGICPAAAPFRCSSGECRHSRWDCHREKWVEETCTPRAPFLAASGACVMSQVFAVNAPREIHFNSTLKTASVACVGDCCADFETAPIDSLACPPEAPYRCNSGNCAAAPRSCISPFTGCGADTTYRHIDGYCGSSCAAAPPPTTSECPAVAPYTCWDGGCRRTPLDCPPGNSRSASVTPCPSTSPVLCMIGGYCVGSAVDCVPHFGTTVDAALLAWVSTGITEPSSLTSVEATVVRQLLRSTTGCYAGSTFDNTTGACIDLLEELQGATTTGNDTQALSSGAPCPSEGFIVCPRGTCEPLAKAGGVCRGQCPHGFVQCFDGACQPRTQWFRCNTPAGLLPVPPQAIFPVPVFLQVFASDWWVTGADTNVSMLDMMLEAVDSTSFVAVRSLPSSFTTNIGTGEAEIEEYLPRLSLQHSATGTCSNITLRMRSEGSATPWVESSRTAISTSCNHQSMSANEWFHCISLCAGEETVIAYRRTDPSGKIDISWRRCNIDAELIPLLFCSHCFPHCFSLCLATALHILFSLPLALTISLACRKPLAVPHSRHSKSFAFRNPFAFIISVTNDCGIHLTIANFLSNTIPFTFPL